MGEGLLLADELLLLLVPRRAGPNARLLGTEAALATTVLVELVETSQLRFTDDGVTLRLADGHPLVPDRLDRIGNVPDLISWFGDPIYRTVLERLTAQGLLEPRRIRGWRLVDPAPRDALVAELSGVLVDDVPATARTGALIALLHVLGAVKATFPGMRPAGLFRAAWLAAESRPVCAFTKAIVPYVRGQVGFTYGAM